MTTKFVASTDKVNIAYDVEGDGPAIILLHGGGSSRQDWHEEGYVKRLKSKFKVICVDLRGHGESELRTDAVDYRIDQMAEDILAVADSSGVDQFTVWGFSYGGKVGRYLARFSDRVSKLVMMSTPMGAAVSDDIRKEIESFCHHWSPIIAAQNNGTLDLNTLTQEDRHSLDRMNVPVMMAWGGAMLDWPSIEPQDFRCPTLWIAGSEDPGVIESVEAYQHALEGTQVQLAIMDSLSHEQVFEEIDMVFDSMVAFTLS